MMRTVLAVLLIAGLATAQALFDRGKPRVYTGENLSAIGFPIGGIGTGNIWIDGRGDLSVWQIFNNMNEKGCLPLGGFAIRVKPTGGKPEVRILGTGKGYEFPPAWTLKVAGFRADYPFGWFRFACPGLPVEVSMEVFNPMIPLNQEDSSLPCAIFRLTAKNTGDKPIEVSFLGLAQNGVGYDGESRIDGGTHDGFGGNVNRHREGSGYRAIHMSMPGTVRPRLARKVKVTYLGRTNRALETCENLVVKRFPRHGKVKSTPVLWLDGLGADCDPRCLTAMAAVAAKGGRLLLTNTRDSFFDLVSSIKKKGMGRITVYEDFEAKDYGEWVATGEAFGRGPAGGTLPEQQRVSGFVGSGLVNSYLNKDKATGTLTSPPFTIEHDYIGFLVGGGAHRGMTCMNLLVNGQVVATVTGRNHERLSPGQWHVAKWRGRQARLQIVDKHTCAWGHINIDQIVFSDLPPAALLGREEALKAIVPHLPLVDFSGPYHAGGRRQLRFSGGKYHRTLGSKWRPCHVYGFGAGHLLVNLHPSSLQGIACLAEELGIRFRWGTGLPDDSPRKGTMALGSLGGQSVGWTKFWPRGRRMASCFSLFSRLGGPSPGRSFDRMKKETEPTKPAQTLVGAMLVPFTLAPGESRTATFVHAWSFPNLSRYGHEGNLYAERFPDAGDVVEYVAANFERLYRETKLYRDTLYETNLPYWMLDCLSANSCIPRTVLCFHAARHKDTGKPYFAGYEGCYGCCPLNCTHVWNYAQTHARLWPSLGRNLRWYDFKHYLRPTGEHQHRQHHPSSGFIDGHCAVINGAYREHLLSRDDRFLREIWPGVRRATEWLIRKIDRDEDGVNGGRQWNTYDVATDGAHTFLGSQYLAALAAAERMAGVVGDRFSVDRWAKIRAGGMKRQNELLWNGEYYIQKPDPKPARDYITGCHSDQLLGQWWAGMLDTGALYPRDRVVSALKSVFKYNYRTHFRGFHQRPRRYVLDDEGGLLMCTWPKGGRPDPFILYADEVWTGIEYSTAGLMIQHGLLEEAFTIVKTARDRYDGRLRQGLNSGPGGNPFCELECGRFYARALSSWSLLLACQGFIYDGPQKTLGFLPKWRPDDHQSFFTAAEGWGLYRQERVKGILRGPGGGSHFRAKVDVRWGRVEVARLVLGRTHLRPGWTGVRPGQPSLRVEQGGRSLQAALVPAPGGRDWIVLTPPAVIVPGRPLVVTVRE